MAEREVRYCTTEDGVRIAYCVEGEGPALLVCPMLVESFSLDSLDRVEFTSRLGAGRSLIRYDMRGTGLSQRDVSQVSLDTMLTDLRAVVQVVGRPVSIWGDTGSGLTAIKYAAETAGSLDALILYGAYARPLDFLTRESMDAFATLAEANWQVAARTFADLGDAPPENGLVWAQSASGTVVAELLRSAIDADVSPFLSKITARTLVINRLDDIFCPISVAQGLAAKIRNVRLVTPPGREHAAFTGDYERVLEAAIAFLDEDPATRALTIAPSSARTTDSAFRVVLFTDLVGHTEMMSRLGDECGRDVLREHETIIRNVLKQNGGTEVKTMGDGFMASFGSVTKAVECAVALQRAFAEREGEPLSVRVGLNAGEPIEEDGDLFGATVILASRIAAKADGGEILVADTVRGLCSGKGFLFADRGEFVAKGFEEPVRVYEVNWRNG